MSIWHKIKTLLGKAENEALHEPESICVEPAAETGCCSNAVHIAFRGIGDDRLYLSRDRQWQEVRYYRPNGLKVFCARCRRRLI